MRLSHHDALQVAQHDHHHLQQHDGHEGREIHSAQQGDHTAQGPQDGVAKAPDDIGDRRARLHPGKDRADDEQPHHPGDRHPRQPEQGHPGQPCQAQQAAQQQPEQQVLRQLDQQPRHEAGPVPAAGGGDDAAQRHHQPVAEGEDQPADRVGKRNALRLHVQAQQAGAGEQAADHVQQERSNLEEHGTSS